MSKRIDEGIWWSLKNWDGSFSVNYKVSHLKGVKLADSTTWKTDFSSEFDPEYYDKIGFLPKEFVCNDST